jgi:glutamate-1-semialdehyde 2,1-aminomutase
MPKERELLESAKRLFPGGVLGRHLFPASPGHVIAHGEGVNLFDHSGSQYIDYTCGGGALLLGYGHPAVSRAIKEQVKKGENFISILNEPAVNLAKKIERVIPSAEKIRFVTSGSDGTNLSLRLARAYTGKQKILKFEGAYHGGHDYAMWSYSPTTEAAFPQPVADSAGLPNSVGADVLIGPYNDTEVTAEIIRKNKDQLAAVIVEPCQRQIEPTKEFLSIVKKVCARSNIVFILDETVTGFRLAIGGAQEKFRVDADIVVLGKTLGGGLPLAAIVGRADIMDLCDPLRARDGSASESVFISSTLGGNPVVCAAGDAFLGHVIEHVSYQQFHDKCEMLKDGLRSLIHKKSIPAQVLGVGPMWQMVFSESEIKSYRDLLRSDKRTAMTVDQELVKQGIFVRPGGPHYFSMAHSDSDVNKTLEAADRALSGIQVSKSKRAH